MQLYQQQTRVWSTVQLQQCTLSHPCENQANAGISRYEGNSPVLTSRNYSSVGSYSAPSLALDRTLSLRSSRPHWEVQAADWEVTASVQEAPEISPITGPSSTQRLEIVDRDEDMDDDGEADSEAANRFEVVERTRKRRPASGKVSQGKGKKRQPKMHTCSQCSKRFPRPSGLETHITSVHSGQKRICSIVGPSTTLANCNDSIWMSCAKLQ